jgi:hypothetical protein
VVNLGLHSKIYGEPFMTPKEIVPLSAAIDDILKSMGHKTHKLDKVSDGEIILAIICSERYINGN